MLLEILEHILSNSLMDAKCEPRNLCILLLTYFIEVSMKDSSLLEGGRESTWFWIVGEDGGIGSRCVPRILHVGHSGGHGGMDAGGGLDCGEEGVDR